jgi:uncharacterized glyoxalase superfamily metalloenzyme YdcJ
MLEKIAKKIINIRPVDVALKAIVSIRHNQIKRALIAYAEKCDLFKVDDLLSEHTNLRYWEWNRIAIQDILRSFTDDYEAIQDISKKIINIHSQDVLNEAKRLLDTKSIKKINKAVKKEGLAFLPKLLNDIEPGMYDQCLKSLITGILKEELYEKTYQEATK